MIKNKNKKIEKNDTDIYCILKFDFILLWTINFK